MASATVPLYPSQPITAGRYLLDGMGRLQPMHRRRFVHVCAIVTVRPKVAQVEPIPALAVLPSPAAPESDPDDVMAEFSAALAKVRARKAEPPKEGARVAAALIRRAAQAKQAPKPRPKRQALSGNECVHCGIPGFRGCEHFLPYVAESRT